MISKPIHCVLIFSAIALPCTVRAADEGEHLFVTATRADIPANDIPAVMQTITAQDIERSSASTLAEVLAAQPGIQLIDFVGNGGRSISIMMRGFGESSVNNVLVLINGRKLNNPSLEGPDLGSVALADIERIEILQGSAGSLYGDQSAGGVINIILRTQSAHRGELRAQRGSYDHEDYSVGVDPVATEQWRWHIFARKALADNYRDNNAADLQQQRMQLAYEGRDLHADIAFDHQDDDLQLPGALSSAQVKQDRRQASTPGSHSDRDTRSAQAHIDADFSPIWQGLIDASYRKERNDGVISGSGFDSTTKANSLQPRVLARFDLGARPWSVLLGIDQEKDEYEANYFGLTQISQTLRDAYASLQASVSDDWSLNTALRHVQRDYSDKPRAYDSDEAQTVYQVGAAWQVSSAWRWYLRRDEAFRWPNVDENGFIEAGKTHLEPQSSVSSEFGSEWQEQHIRIAANLYHLDIDNEIVYDPTANGPFGAGSGANVNLDRSIHDGAQLDINWRLLSSLQLKWGYSYTDAHLEAGPFRGKHTPLVAAQRSTLALDWQFVDTFSAHTEALYTGSRYNGGDMGNTADKLGGYTLYNAALRWHDDALTASLRANNIGNKRYDSYSGATAFGDYRYPAALSQYELSVAYAF